MRARTACLVVPSLLVACDRPAPPAVTADKDVPSATTAPPVPAPSPSPATVDAVADAAFALPAVDDTCGKDADCEAITVTLDGPYVCCPGCVRTFPNVGWIKAMKAACASHPPGQCPPLGCVMSIPHPKCVAGHCIDAK